jgi:hypothetical protein
MSIKHARPIHDRAGATGPAIIIRVHTQQLQYTTWRANGVGSCTDQGNIGNADQSTVIHDPA